MSDPKTARFEIPNPQVHDTAVQFFDAHKKLHVVMGGTLMPMLHCGAISIELFLKCLSASDDDVSENGDEGGALCYAKPSRGHTLTKLLDALHDDVRGEIAASFGSRFPGEELEDALLRAEGIFMPSRYPYESGTMLPTGSVDLVCKLAEFLATFVSALRPRHVLTSSD